MSSVYEVTHDDTTYYVEEKDVGDSSLEDALNTTGSALSSAPFTAAPMQYVYRKMCVEECEKALQVGGMVALETRTAEKWFTESLDHTRVFQNSSVTAPEVVAEFGLPRQPYTRDIRGPAIAQQGSKARQPVSGRPYNVFNKEQLKHAKNKVNIGLKGADNVKRFNKHIVSVQKIKPNGFMNRHAALRWMRRNKMRCAMAVIGVVLDGVSLTLSIIADGGKFGRQTTITVAEIAGGAVGAGVGAVVGATVAGSAAGVALSATSIGASICSIIPGIGTAIGAFLGGLIGSLVAGGLTRFFLGHQVVPGPGAPVLQSDPLPTAFGVPNLAQSPNSVQTDPSGPPPGVFGAPDSCCQPDDDFPVMWYQTHPQ